MVLITGASSGIGAELAQQYAGRGVRLALVARRQKELQAVASLCEQLGSPQVFTLTADMGNIEEAVRVINSSVASLGRLDAVVLNHAAFQTSLTLEYDSPAAFANDIRRVFAPNVEGTAAAALAALPSLSAAKGRLAIVSSGSVIVPPPQHAVYAASKSAMDTLTAAIRSELVMAGIPVSVTTLLLGLIATDANVNKGDALASQAMPVADCAAEMVCALDSRESVAFIPSFMGLYSTLIHHFPAVAGPLMAASYYDHLPGFWQSVANAKAAWSARSVDA